MDPYATSHFSNDALRHDLKTRVAHDCKSRAVLLSRIGEFDERKLYLEEAHPSMYSYCLCELHFSEGTASWHIYAARAARRFPLLFVAVAEGRLHLTAVVMLSKYLTSGNVDELVVAATHKSKAEIQQLIADRFPKPDLPERLEAIMPPLTMAGQPVAPHWPANAGPASFPTAPPDLGLAQQHLPANAGPAGHPIAPPDLGPTCQHWPANADGRVPPDFQQAPGSDLLDAYGLPATLQASGPVGRASPENAAAPGPRAKVTPLAPQRFGFQITVDQETHDLWQYARSLMSHEVPAGEMARVFKGVLKLAVAELEKRKFGATSRPGPTGSGKSPRHIPAAVKHEVWERDGGQCTFVSDSGKRCPSRMLLEFDHRDPVARGGASTAENLRLRCRAHNMHAAERVFGAEFVAGKLSAARREG